MEEIFLSGGKKKKKKKKLKSLLIYYHDQITWGGDISQTAGCILAGDLFPSWSLCIKKTNQNKIKLNIVLFPFPTGELHK